MKWKCPSCCSEKWECFKSFLSRCGRYICKCCGSCGSGCKRCYKDRGYRVIRKQQIDGRIILVKEQDEQESFINRSFEDFYYLQTYLQAKYPDFKWPSLPLHNVLTIADQRHLTKMREDYISDIVQLLQPNVWRHHSEIEKVMQTFATEEEWHGSKCYSRFRMYILILVNSAGHKTGPDLVMFILFFIGYSLFVHFLFYDKVEYGKLLFLFILFTIFLSILVTCGKNASMKPPTIWHTHAKIKRDKNIDEHQTYVKQVEVRAKRTKYEAITDPNETELQNLEPNTTGDNETSPLVEPSTKDEYI